MTHVTCNVSPQHFYYCTPVCNVLQRKHHLWVGLSLLLLADLQRVPVILASPCETMISCQITCPRIQTKSEKQPGVFALLVWLKQTFSPSSNKTQITWHTGSEPRVKRTYLTGFLGEGPYVSQSWLLKILCRTGSHAPPTHSWKWNVWVTEQHRG